MASKSNHIRSNSFPSRSHPTTLRVEEVLSKINSSELPSGSSESICYGLCRLAELYQSMNNYLNLPSTIQALSQQKGSEAFLDGSLRTLDVCSIAKEFVSQLKENVRDLQSSLRRRKADSSMESSLNSYNCFRKKMKKDARRLVADLKQIDQSVDENEPIFSLIKEVNSTTTAVFRSVLIFLASKKNSSKWSLISRLVKQCEDQECENELESVDSALQSLCRNDQSESEKIQSIQTRLASLEASIDGVENGLEGLFRCLIKSRTSFLNILSC